MNSPAWTLDQLTDRVADALWGDGGSGETDLAQSNGRVREIPDGRTIRWYQTSGLVDRPAMRGRTALYGLRHLAQVVAIKRLQSEGRSLAEIQAYLAGMPTAALARVARLPDFQDAGTDASAAVPDAPAPRRFWTRTEESSEDADHLGSPIAAALPGPPSRVASPAADRAFEGTLSYAVKLGAGVLLVLDEATTIPDAGDVAAIRSLAGVLMRELRRRGLAPVSNPQEG